MYKGDKHILLPSLTGRVLLARITVDSTSTEYTRTGGDVAADVALPRRSEERVVHVYAGARKRRGSCHSTCVQCKCSTSYHSLLSGREGCDTGVEVWGRESGVATGKLPTTRRFGSLCFSDWFTHPPSHETRGRQTIFRRRK